MMRQSRRIALAILLAGAPIVALSAQDAPESLLPPGFDDPAPAPPPARPAVSPSAPTQSSGATPASRPVVQPLPDSGASADGSAPSDEQIAAMRRLLERLPSVDELEKMDTDEIDELLGLKPSFDIPPAARRSTNRVGLLSVEEGGMPSRSLGNTSGSYVARILAGTKGPLVSRWGHIMLRRALSSRLDAPAGMSGVRFAALRTDMLLRLGEAPVARALVQEVDTADYSPRLVDAAFNAYVTMGDFTGACPMTLLHARVRDDYEWNLLRGICSTFAGESGGMDRIDRYIRRGELPRIDALLAQKYAGSVGDKRRAVTIEWDDVDELTRWRYGLATATGSEIPAGLIARGGKPFQLISAINPAAGLLDRVAGARVAASQGILSSAALVDLYSQIYEDADLTGVDATLATQLREAYVGDASSSLSAMQDIWGEGDDNAARRILTAYAAARMPVSEDLSDSAGLLIASMLSAGLDRNAMRWAGVVDTGSFGWGLLAVASPYRDRPFTEGAIREFIDGDETDGTRRSRFLVAGLAGLGRLAPDKVAELSRDLDLQLDRQTEWSRAITRSGDRGNRPLTAFLAALGMQGSSWDRMTPRHLYFIVSALRSAGLEAEARMIAAEAVSQG